MRCKLEARSRSARRGRAPLELQKANCVGRHHPGGDKEFGGTANFLYCDGHVERKTVYESIRKREWGDKFYSLTGANDVLPFR